GPCRTVDVDGEFWHLRVAANLAVRLYFEAPANRAQARAPVPLLKPHDVVPAIDEDCFAGDARARLGKQKGSGRADFGGIDIALERGALHLGLEHVAEVRNSARRQRLDRPGGNSV